MDLSTVYDALTPRQRNVIDAFTDWKAVFGYSSRRNREFTACKGYKRSHVSWTYNTPSGTHSVIASLAKKGFFTVTERANSRSFDGVEQHYTLTPAAVEFFAAKRDALQAERRERDLASQERHRVEQAKAKASQEAIRAILDKYNDEFTELRDALEAKYLAQ